METLAVDMEAGVTLEEAEMDTETDSEVHVTSTELHPELLADFGAQW